VSDGSNTTSQGSTVLGTAAFTWADGSIGLVGAAMEFGNGGDVALPA
jgi:hypothetical protein